MKKFGKSVLAVLFTLVIGCFSSCNLISSDKAAGAVKIEFDGNFAKAVSERAALQIQEEDLEPHEFFRIQVDITGDYTDSAYKDFNFDEWHSLLEGTGSVSFAFENIPVDSNVNVKVTVSKSWGTETHTIMAGESEPITIHAGENHIPLNLSYVEDYNSSEPDPVEPKPEPETSTTAGITVTLAELNSEDLAEKIELKSEVTSDMVTLTAGPKSDSNITVTSYSWNVTYGNQPVEGTAADGMWTISAGDLGSGIYNVTLTVQIAGEYYSGSTTFTITKE
ncbi:hypothetical protein MSI_02100 [Treponema sp. JC4]|uniref:hypothetical protein n=1 Tax=Treponema sp. JC4 TaxID=1124982 RepID=UPI00025B0D4C|nr:hypothetical protein [Treponema sp. JC4]EID86254.1 hypothetical protein MSI_02100 [Treponema sp. JC4]